jgi:hypothetical protein
MSVVVVDLGMLRSVSQLGNGWPRVRRVGLFSNDVTIDRHTTFASLTPAAFSGYDGERDIGTWSVPVIEGDRAIVRAAPIIWTYDGGVPSGYVWGYYVVDDDGELLWADKRPELPVAMVAAGQNYTVIPVMTAGTRFGGTT